MPMHQDPLLVSVLVSFTNTIFMLYCTWPIKDIRQWPPYLIEAKWCIIYVGKLSITGSDNGLSPDRHQAIIWTNAGIMLIEPLGTKFSEILIEIHIFWFKEMYLKISSGKWRSFCFGPNVLNASVSIASEPSSMYVQRVLSIPLIKWAFCCPFHCDKAEKWISR